MNLGARVKKAIEESGFSTEAVAGKIGMSYNNLYRLYKKDSFEIKYLIQIAELLKLPLSYFLNDETIGAALSQQGIGNAGRDISNQNIMNGQDETKRSAPDSNIENIAYKLQMCEEQKKSLLEKLELKDQLLATKDMLIEQLKK